MVGDLNSGLGMLVVHPSILRIDLHSGGALRGAAFPVVVPGRLSSEVWNTLGELAWVNRIVTEVWHMHLALPTLCTVDEPDITADAMLVKRCVGKIGIP